mmetsp:Transcript_29811/g.61324  ORF Transcript_29811/g.61324 Transcript_29811/m.61324 type:complete len:172 (+) Transcript_29811:49-564(+)
MKSIVFTIGAATAMASSTSTGFASSFVPPSSLVFPSRPSPLSPSPSSSSFIFGPSSSAASGHSSSPTHRSPHQHNARSTTTKLHSFFGLGLPEIAIILVTSLFLIGPSKLISAAKDAGTAAGKAAAGFEDGLGGYGEELKKIPEEFSKGLEEGEVEARSRKAKKIKPVDED